MARSTVSPRWSRPPTSRWSDGRLLSNLVEVFCHPRDNTTEDRDIVLRNPRIGLCIDVARELEQPVAHALSFRREADKRDAPISRAAHTADQAGFLHATKRDHRGRLHHADALGEFALRHAVL